MQLLPPVPLVADELVDASLVAAGRALVPEELSPEISVKDGNHCLHSTFGVNLSGSRGIFK